MVSHSFYIFRGRNRTWRLTWPAGLCQEGVAGLVPHASATGRLTEPEGRAASPRGKRPQAGGGAWRRRLRGRRRGGRPALGAAPAPVAMARPRASRGAARLRGGGGTGAAAAATLGGSPSAAPPPAVGPSAEPLSAGWRPHPAATPWVEVCSPGKFN